MKWTSLTYLIEVPLARKVSETKLATNTASQQPPIQRDKFALQARPFIHELASKCKLHRNHAMKNHPLRILNKRCLQSIRILNLDRLDVAVEFLLRALLVVIKRVDSRGKLCSILILARSAMSATSSAIS